METFLVSFWFILGIICARMARKRGKNPYLFFSIGLLFGILGIAFLYFFGQHKKVETVLQPTRITPTSFSLWYYINQENKTCGPVSFTVLEDELRIGVLNPSTYVWSEEFDHWKQIKDLPYF